MKLLEVADLTREGKGGVGEGRGREGKGGGRENARGVQLRYKTKPQL